MLHKSPYLNTEYLGILQKKSGVSLQRPLTNKWIRKAIHHAIDRRKLILYLRNSIGYPADQGFVPPVLLNTQSPSNYGYAYNPEVARSFIKLAGYSEKNPVPEIRLTTVSTYADLASYISGELKKVGITLNIDVVPKSLLLTQMAGNRIEFFRGSWIADYPDAENFLSVFYSKNPSPPNYTRYSNPMFDEWYETALMEDNNEQRLRLYMKLDSLVTDDAPVIPLWYDQVIHLVQPNIKEFEPHPLNLLELRRVKKL